MKKDDFIQVMNTIVYLVIFIHLNLVVCHIPDSPTKLKCNFSDNEAAKSAYERAKTLVCKEEIEHAACYFKSIASLGDSFNHVRLKTSCPYVKPSYEPILQIEASTLIDELDEDENNNYQPIVDSEALTLKPDGPVICRDICLTYYGFKYAAFRKTSDNISDLNNSTANSTRCICLKDVEAFNLTSYDNESNSSSSYFDVYLTGAFARKENMNPYVPSLDRQDSLRKFEKLRANISKIGAYKQNVLPKIVFLFTVNQRSYYRQIVRLIKTLYDDHHYYYIHIDQRSTYLRKKFKELEDELKGTSFARNIRVANWSMATIWGGSSLLTMHLKAMTDLLRLRKKNEWDWDYIINLSEADFPIKSVYEFTLYISQFKNGENLIGFRSSGYPIFELSDIQQLMWHFVECEERMWRVSPRKLPIGLQIEGAMDWFFLNVNFVSHMLQSGSNHVIYLRKFFNYSLHSPEMFYHTALMNSPFCSLAIDESLRLINFKKENGRSCVCDQIIDSCGCSPSFFRIENAWELSFPSRKTAFFARKFDPIFNLDIINNIDKRINGPFHEDTQSLDSYWFNVYERGVDKWETFDAKQRRLFSLFTSDSLSKLCRVLDSCETTEENKDDASKHLKSVHGFTKSNTFQGFVFNLEINGTDFEAFYRIQSEKNIETITNHFELKHQEFFNQTQCLREHHEYFFKYLTKIEVSTDLDLKEMRAKNYAGLIDDSDEIIMVIYFNKQVDQSLDFYTELIEPSGEIYQREKWNLSTEFEPEENYIYTYFSIPPDKPRHEAGLWALRVIVEYDYVQPNEPKVRKENLFIVYKFLIQTSVREDMNVSSNSILSEEYYLKNRFWSFDSICLNEPIEADKNSLAKKRTKICDKNAHWSSFYPDSKSDLKSKIGHENKNLEYFSSFNWLSVLVTSFIILMSIGKCNFSKTI